jgi:hypothetical protein
MTHAIGNSAQTHPGVTHTLLVLFAGDEQEHVSAGLMEHGTDRSEKGTQIPGMSLGRRTAVPLFS